MICQEVEVEAATDSDVAAIRHQSHMTRETDGPCAVHQINSYLGMECEALRQE